MSKAPPATERARGTTLGLGAFEKISAVEGLRLTPEMKRDLQQLDAAPMTAAERTRFITAKYGQPAHPRTGLEESNIYDTILEIVEYLDAGDRSPFAEWFDGLDPQAARKVTVALTRIELGNLAHTKGVGAGLLEAKIEFGPGYRLYFGRDGARLIILLAGGTKRRQQADIAAAQARWVEYKQRRKEDR